MKLRELKRQLELHGNEKNIIDFFRFLRIKFLRGNLPPYIKKILERGNIENPVRKYAICDPNNRFDQVRKSLHLDWGNLDFHLNYRVTNLSDLSEFLPKIELERTKLNKIIEKGYLLSILPLNLLLPQEVLNQFIPPSDFMEPHPLKDKDPYGIYSNPVRIINGQTKLPLGSLKFKHTILMDIQGSCPIGCSDCYKSYYTREKGHDLGVCTETLKKQAKQIVKWMNNHPDVYDVIISGGEPLTTSNSNFEELFFAFEKAKYLKVLRICTGTVFLGLPFRIDDAFLKIISGFCKKTGVRFTFQANLSNHYQITPEAIIAIQKIKKYGFDIYSQVPLREGLNFFSDNLEKTVFFLKELARRQFLVGVESYKFIVDMHPRTLAYYVPIEILATVFSQLFDVHWVPELERPKTLSVLTKQGNLILSWHSLFAMKKKVDRKKGYVRYQIPKIIFGDKLNIESFIYEEPLMPLNEDPDSIEKLLRNWFSQET
ncbi:MAG: 4Fe-4S cluster-binding domain-containing protein [Nitrospirae bacterium]|nr:4Fe-4S cluster-binding domain-containing protein [Nitrospirota bacterium]